MHRTVIVLCLSAIPVGGTVAVLFAAPGLAVALSDHQVATLHLTLPLAVLWAIVLGWIVARLRGLVLGFIVFGGVIAGINAVTVATIAAQAAVW